jgi:competence protein ComGC
MRRQLLLIIVSTVGPLIVTAVPASAQQKQQSKQKQAPSKAQTQSMTGCVDQQDGRYVLIHDRTRSTIANLEAEGFPDEGFAKHMGHKVTVRGTSSPAGTERPVFRVRSVEIISDDCGPPQHYRE